MKVEEKFVETKFVETKYGKICYEEWGKGEKTAVFFHGFLGGIIHGESFAKKLSSKGWRVLVPGLPGHGKSFEIPKGYNFKSLVATMEEFLEKTAPGGAVLAGHSLGGAVAWEIACQRPNLVKKLILIDPGLEISRGSLVARGLKAILNNLFLDRKGGGKIYPLVWNLKALNLLDGLKTTDLTTDMPVLAMFGKDDKVTSAADGAKKFKGLKNLKVRQFPGGHHWYRWQEEKFLQAIEEFL